MKIRLILLVHVKFFQSFNLILCQRLNFFFQVKPTLTFFYFVYRDLCKFWNNVLVISEFQFRRGGSVLSFSNKMSLPTSRPRTRQSEPIRPASRQTPIRERTSVTSRPASRQTVQRPTSFVQKESATPRKNSTPTVSSTNLDQAYKHASAEGETKPLWYRDSDNNSGKLQAPVLPSMRLQVFVL